MSITTTFTEALGITRETDSDMQKVLDALESMNPRPIEALTPEAARLQPTPADAVKQVMLDEGMSMAPEQVSAVSTLSIAGPNGDIPLHVYTPEGRGPFPLILYFHGGGFVIASTEVYDATPRSLANAAEAVVVSVDYHLAPEHKYPAAVDDAFAAYRWVLQNAQQLNAIPGKVAVAGESAGGNLATVVCLKAREENMHLPLHQLLVYPVVANDFETKSYVEHADAKPLNKSMMLWFFKHYEGDPGSQYALPMKAASLRGLPPATVITAEIDPLASEGRDYAERLEAAGVEVSYRHYHGVTHEFFGMGALVKKARDALLYAAGNLKQAFSGDVVETADPAALYTGFKASSMLNEKTVSERTGASENLRMDETADSRQTASSHTQESNVDLNERPLNTTSLKGNSQMDNDELISTLNDLIETSKDGEEGFKTCAEDLNDPMLKASFTQRSQQCAEGAEELQQLVLSLGGKPETKSSLSGTLHRRWVDIKSAVTGKDEASVLEECERGEDIAIRSYQNALDKDLPPHVRAIVERQFAGVRSNHDQVKVLRDNAVARS